jgi:2-C-methyl-D-erythritol 2,4-cyclodiphosphate synthase
MRIGYGYDIHNLTEGRDLILGGIKIPYIRGLEGFSDADVLIHAICDALLGAMAKGDIGEHFPQTNERYRNISSAKLLGKVVEMLKKEGYVIANIDTLILAEEPKLEPFKKRIKESLLKVLNLEANQLNIKATTAEGKGSVGQKEAIAAEAVVLIDKN